MLRKEKIALLLWLLSIPTVIWIARFPLCVTYDGGVYIYGAKSLAQGQDFQFVDSKGGRHPESGWPPGYSMAIAAFHLLTRQGLVASARGINCISSLLFLFLWLFFFTKIIRGAGFAFLASIILLVSPGHWNFLGVALSEGLFMVFLGLAALSVYYAHTYLTGKPHTFWILVLSLSILAACLTRYAGLAFAMGTTIFLFTGLFTSKKQRALFDTGIFLSVMVAGALPWLIRNKWATGKYSLMIPINTQIIDKISLRTILDFLSKIGFQVFSLPDSLQTAGLFWTALVLSLTIFSIFYLKKFRCEAFYSSPLFWMIAVSLCYIPLLFYTTLAFFSFFHLKMRYYWILTPFLIGLFTVLAEALSHALKKQPSILARILLGGIWIVLFVTGFSGASRSYAEIKEIFQRKDALMEGVVFYPEVFGSSKEAIDWLKKNLRHEDLLFSNYSKFVPVLWEGDLDCFQAEVDLNKQVKEWSRPYQKVYLLLSKSNFHYQNRLEWTEYLSSLKYRVFFEDSNTFLCEVSVKKD